MTKQLNWDEYFMSLAKLSQMRSKDPAMKVGAVLVTPQKRIVGIGYNGFPDRQGYDIENIDNDMQLPWGKTSEKYSNTKHAYVIHAEENAIINATTRDLQGCRVYVTHFPCNHCAKILIQNGITEVIYDKPPKQGDKHIEMYTASYRLLQTYGVETRQLNTDIKLNIKVVKRDVT